jgi:hypothetical protein
LLVHRQRDVLLDVQGDQVQVDVAAHASNPLYRKNIRFSRSLHYNSKTPSLADSQ